MTDPNAPNPRGNERAAFERAEAVFFEVAALAPGDRDEAIIRMCGGDTALEAQVRALVNSAARIGSFLEQPALGRRIDQLADEAGVREPPDELIGATVGPFRVVRRIASGGMGTVYLAARNDGQFEQTVALKVVKRGMDSEEILRRFRSERQTLAALDHPNIARLLDGGVTPDGRPFLVMEYVDGRPIDEYCDEHRLRIRDRLALFRAVCDGVHHAHRNLVIHRDLKPGNILVTPQGIPKLLDFGIAKVLSGTTATHTTADTDRRLTPEYASPEQVQGQTVTTASDVYALGVILYRLLTGSHPYHFALRTADELRQIVCETIPPAPSAAVLFRTARPRGTSLPPGQPEPAPTQPPPTAATLGQTRGVSSTRLRSQLRGDLDNIVLMALRKEPQRRYASAEQFGADIGRYLDGMPVQARKDTGLYRASKFIARHPVGVTLAILLVSTLSASTVLLSRQRERLLAQRAALLASNQRLEQTRRYLQEVIGSADASNQGPDAKLGTVLKDAIAALTTSPPGDPLTRAAAEQAIGRAAMSLGMLSDARTLLTSAERGFASLPAGDEALSDLRLDLAELLFFEGKPTEAEARFREMLALEDKPGQNTERLGVLLNDLGASLRAQGRFKDAIAAQRRALAVRTAVHGAQSLPVAETRNNLASALFQDGSTDEAIAEFEGSLAVRKSRLRADHPLVIRLQSNLGLAYLRAGRADDAAAILARTAEAWDAAFGPEHPGRIPAITSLSLALRKQGKRTDAIQWLSRALQWQKAHPSQTATQVAATEANIAMTQAELGQDAEAETTLGRVLPLLRADGRAISAVARNATESLATIYERQGRSSEAASLKATIGPK